MEGLEELSASLGPRELVSITARVARRPDLWRTALRQARRLAPHGWWRRPPFLPLPDPSYARFRSVTMYGGDGTAPNDPDDVVAWLEWCKEWPHPTR